MSFQPRSKLISRRRVFSGGLLAVALSACSAATQPAPDPKTETASAAVTSGASGPEECTPQMVAWDLAPSGVTANTCSAGIEYTKWNDCSNSYPTGDSTHCPALSVPTPSIVTTNTCSYATQWVTATHTATLPRKLICGLPTKPPCQYQYIGDCNALGNADQLAINHGARYTGAVQQQPAAPATSTIGAASGYAFGSWADYPNDATENNGTCSWTIENFPLMVSSANAFECGQTTTPQPPTTTYPACTIQCPENGTTSADLAAGAAITSVPNTDTATYPSGNLDTTNCVSAEDIPIPTSGDPTTAVQAKWTKLQANLATAQAGGFAGIGSAAAAGLVVTESKLLFEYYGNYLSAAEQAAAVALYLEYPSGNDTPSCGVSSQTFVPPQTAGCTADPGAIAKLNSEMTFCARLTDHHVNPAVRQLEAVNAVCVDQLTANIGALRGSLLASGFDDGTAGPVIGPGGVVSDAGADAEAGAAPEAGAIAEAGSGSGNADPNDVCGFKSYRAQYDTFVTNAIEGRMEVSTDPTNAANQPEVLSRLQLIDRWYRALASELYPWNQGEPYASSVQSAAWAHASTMEGTFWNGMYRNLFPSAAVTAADAGTLTAEGGVATGGSVPPPTFTAAELAALTQDTLNADRAVLGLLYPTAQGATPPLQSTPLLYLTADALEAMSQRMHDVGVYHDMGCAYVGCGPAAQSELVWLMELLASIPNAGTLQSAWSAAGAAKNADQTNVVGSDWLAVYGGLSSQHGALESALQNAVSGGAAWSYAVSGAPVMAAGTTLTVPAPARHLVGLIESAAVAQSTYAATGLFNPTPRNRLASGIAQDNIDAIRSDIQQKAVNLGGAVGAFNTNLSSIANSVIQEMTTTTAMTNSLDALEQKGADFDNTVSDIDGLRDSLEANQRELGAFAASYAQAASVEQSTLVTATPYGPWTFDATTARAAGPLAPNGDVSTIATRWVKGLTKGTIVTVQVGANDKWAPTCALSQQGSLPSPTSAATYPVDVSGALAGPDGYVVMISNNAYVAQANATGSSSSTMSNADITAKLCAGIHAQAGISFLGNGSYGYIDLSMCASLGHTDTWGSSTSNTSTTGNQTQSSLSAASGLRLPSTPVPAAPVGALLAVVTSPGAPTQITDIRVVEAPATGIVLDADSDVYLVTNDITGCSQVDTQHALTVSVATAVHAGDAVKWVQGGLGSVAQLMEGLSAGDPTASTPNIPAGSLVAQGQMTPNQAAEVRATALVELTGACTADPTVTDKTLCDISKLPAPVSEFVDDFIDRELEAIDLKIQLLQGVRSLNATTLQIDQMVDDFNAEQSQASVAELLPQWTLRNLDAVQLEDETSQLVNAATFDLYPVLELRYPDIFAEGLAEDQVLQTELQTLVNAHWDAPVNNLANAAVQAATELYNETATLATTYPPVTPAQIALDFVRPGVTVKQPQYWTVSDGRAQQVWTQATTGNHLVNLRVLPEDLYHAAGGLPGLLCTQEVPVVLDFAVVLSGTRLQTSDETFFTNKPITVRSSSDSQFEFPTAATYDANDNLFSAGGPLQFQLKNLDWATLGTQILVSVDPGSAMVKYNTLRGDTTKNMNGKGLSPFNDFTIDLSSLYDPTIFTLDKPVDEADHIILVFDVQYRNVAPNKTMSWIGTCR